MSWLVDNPGFSMPPGIGSDLSFSPGSKGSSSMYDPISAGITFAGMGLQGILGAISQKGQTNTLGKIAGLENARQNEAILNARDMAKGQIAMGMWSNLFNTTTAADIDFGRQLAAKRKEYSEFIPKGFGLDREQARWQTDFALSPAARELASRQRLGRVKEAIAPGRAQMTGMFGRIAQAPTESFMV